MRNLLMLSLVFALPATADDALREAFVSPPDSARPGVYWYFMDGNLDREGMTQDLESMVDVGIGNLVFLEVNVGVPRGPVDFLSEEWQDLFVHAVREAERLGVEITLGAGPGWTGSGGPWVEASDSMQHLVASTVQVTGPTRLEEPLPVPATRRPYFGGFPADLNARREAWHADVAVLAFPTPAPGASIDDIDGKALYYRDPYTSRAGVKPFLDAPAEFPETPAGTAIAAGDIVDLTDRLQPDGRLDWDVPAGDWTIMRFGVRNNGANTRPAPEPGLGFECDKMSTASLDRHFGNFAGKLLDRIGERKPGAGLTMLHMDSWEMGAQNWTPGFREAFLARRGYDPQPFFPAYTGRVVGSVEETERFLWDLRLTAQELVIENHAEHLKAIGREHGMGLSIEPYDMNPTADLVLGAVADVPMCEFWSEGYGFNSSFSVIEAASLAHVLGSPMVAAEAFTASAAEGMRQFPGSMKNQGDWAFAAGVSRFVYHTFAHQPLGTERPGMTMGPYGVHWDRNATWWPMAEGYHRYVSRCSHLLRQGAAVADILYLIPEGAPHVFQPPADALAGTDFLPDRKGFNFDAVAPQVLLARATVDNGRIAFPGGTAYRVLVLPDFDTMTPGLIDGLRELIEQGATVIGNPPRRSPSLVDYPACDDAVREKATALWGGLEPPERIEARQVGAGRLYTGSSLAPAGEPKRLILDRGQWVWYPQGNPAGGAPAETVLFEKSFNAGKLAEATAEVTADNDFVLTVNGATLLEGDSFHEVYTADIRHALREGENTVTITASNWDPDGNPAGLIALLHLVGEDGSELVLPTDGTWLCRRPDETEWKAAKVLGPAGMGPWGLSQPGPKGGPYPAYGLTAEILQESLNTASDFVSDGPVRYTHRRLADRDLYFVANTEDRDIEASCVFRATSPAPELWDPLTGDMHGARGAFEEGARTVIPLRFAPHQSYFVVFPDAAAAPAPAAAPSALAEAATIDGPWTVTFHEDWGPRGEMVFDQLTDWTESPDEAVRYYSGIATYRVAFDAPAGDGPLYLDLGTVHDIARVRVNGEDLGVVWTAPWRVRSDGVVKPSGNALEVEVANRWANRLIGDQQPGVKDSREVQWPEGYLGGAEYKTGANTFITHRYYGPDSPLLPSGLLGPVQLLR